jgi:GrpB-like predicted nucleotidyltransferase (UPF0157 family)
VEDPDTSEERMLAAMVGDATPDVGDVRLSGYDEQWPRLFERQAERIREALGATALQVEHVGSTSVPGLAAKPIIDILLVVPDSSDEASYVPAMERAGYVLRIRESEWHEHRMFRRPRASLNLHVLSSGCLEVGRMTSFRDRLRENAEDRAYYERTKRDLASRRWRYVQDYADAKTEVVEEILGRIGP